jgi:hypothetical protein
MSIEENIAMGGSFEDLNMGGKEIGEEKSEIED